MKIIVTVLLSLLTTSCYYSTQAYHLTSTLTRQKNIETLLRDESLDAETREFLERSQSIKRFAIETLELKKNKNYTRYVPLDTDYLVVVVHAAPEFSLEPHRWNYPFLGPLSYRGFYKKEDAIKEADKLKALGMDTYTRKVSAFSTLGVLADPLFSTLKEYSLQSLSEVIIHEEYHATVWIKRKQNFNEQMATFIGEEGSRLYLQKYGLQETKALENDANQASQKMAKAARERDRKTMNAILLEIRSDLETLYASDRPEHEMRDLKQNILEQAQLKFMTNYHSLFESQLYREWDLNNLNNAYLSLIATYRDKDNKIETLYREANMNLKDFIQVTKKLEKREYRDDPYESLKQLLQE